MGIRGARLTGAYIDEAAQFADQRANVTTPPAEPRFDEVRGFKNLPPKDQILAASIYAGFRQALREDRLEREAAYQQYEETHHDPEGVLS